MAKCHYVAQGHPGVKFDTSRKAAAFGKKYGKGFLDFDIYKVCGKKRRRVLTCGDGRCKRYDTKLVKGRYY